MSLKHTNLLLLISLFFSFSACATERLNAYEVLAKDLKENGREHVDSSVFIKGFLLIDQGAFLYPDLESVLNYDLDASLFLQIDDYRQYMGLSGCFVEVAGIVGTHKTDKNKYRLKDISYINRSGPLYLMAVDLNKGRDKSVGCELDSIVNGMVGSIIGDIHNKNLLKQ
ncbi:hypothetical protein [Marinagarivorans algicola]|uniref:hypothetical protein n=1 Tax=Marinagarivorans algicola TaxID=1513270 RepID=UPI0006B89402|nr:hypothetical protein [Marinagarivorans algicola]